MTLQELKDEINKIDIYLLDQILKEIYVEDDIILDAGCGKGRNLKWFYNNSYSIYGIDTSTKNIDFIKKNYPLQAKNFSVNKITETPFKDFFFNHVICNAVLHFAADENDFFKMITELIRILKVNGTLFIRVASNIGLEDKITPVKNGIYRLPDGTDRFLINPEIIQKLRTKFDLQLIEPIKTTNVEDFRCMTTLMFRKTRRI